MCYCINGHYKHVAILLSLINSLYNKVYPCCHFGERALLPTARRKYMRLEEWISFRSLWTRNLLQSMLGALRTPNFFFFFRVQPHKCVPISVPLLTSCLLEIGCSLLTLTPLHSETF